MRRTLLLIVFGLALSACGGGGSEVDRNAVQATMPNFVADYGSEFDALSPPPAFDRDDDVLLGFVSTGDDAVPLCDALASYLDDEGFGGVPIRVHLGMEAAVLASGTSGGSCDGE